MTKLLEAVQFAVMAHHGQMRKDVDPAPYAAHPIEVTRLLQKVGVTDETILVAAMLHDTIEDTDTSPDDIIEQFGEAVLNIVLEVTNDPELESGWQKKAQITNAPNLSPGAALVKLADKCCNIEDVVNFPPENWDVKRRKAYIDHGRKVVEGITSTFLRDGYFVEDSKAEPYRKLSAIFDECASWKLV